MRYGPEDLQRDLGLSDAVMVRIEAHRALLAEWSTRMNLIGPSEMERYWERHALDSLQLLKIADSLVRPHSDGKPRDTFPESGRARTWLDLGAGAGFPGLLIGCALADEAGARVDLVESIGKKAAFLREAIAATGAPARVLHTRVEAVVAKPGAYDVVTARAFAPLKRIIEYVIPILDRGAVGLFPKGREAEVELDSVATSGWTLDVDLVPSLTDPQARVIVLRGAKRR